MPIKFKALATSDAEAFWQGSPDAYGHIPERLISDGGSVPCRHCLKQIPAGSDMLVLAYRPFPELQPYAETGPIFLCGSPCERHVESTQPPQMFLDWERLLVRGYRNNNRIKYGTGQVVLTGNLASTCETLFEDPEVAYIHIRSASNNCYQGRVERA